MPGDANERRAFCHIARLLQQRYGRTNLNYYLIANIEPRADKRLPENRLTQLDAFLLGPRVAAIIDFKSCYEPFSGESLEGEWFSPSGYALPGGSFINPYQQAKNAREKWTTYFTQKSNLLFDLPPLAIKTWRDAWQKLNTFVLLHPLLHPDATLPVNLLEKDHYWFHLKSIDSILELAFSCVSDEFVLTPAQQEQIIQHAIFAKDWTDMSEVLHNPVGALVVKEPNNPMVKYEVYHDDIFTVGRSHNQRIRVSRELKQVSKYHARIEVVQGKLIITDAGSLNGMYINETKVADGEAVVMSPYSKIFLGDHQANYACQIWYEPINLRKTSLTHGPVEYDPTELPPMVD